MAINPDWPLIVADWGPYWTCNGATTPTDRLVEITSRTRGQINLQRGRQYELDQIRSGTMDTTLVNTSGAFDPLNTGGPWYGHVIPYQPTRIRAQWPPTQNLLTGAIASGGDVGGYALGSILAQPSIGVHSDTDINSGQIVADATAWQGARVFQFSIPASSPSTQWPGWSVQASVEPGATYTMQMRVRDVTPATTLQVKGVIGFHMGALNSGVPSVFTYGTPATLTGSATATWTQITVTVTAPAGVYGISFGVILAATSPASVTNLQVDGWQLEKAAAASTWTLPGTWYPLYAGFVERYPQSWTMSGTYGTVATTSVDSLSLLSQRVLRDPLTEEIYARGPRFLFTLADPQGSSSVTDAIGAFPPAPLAVGKYGSGSVTFGNQITATNTVTGIYTGSTGTVARVANSNPGTNIISGGATYVSLGNSGIKGPANPTSWTRMLAFRYTGPTPTFYSVMWSSMDGQRVNNPSGSQIYFQIISTGAAVLYMVGPTGVAITATAPGSVVDGNWHLAIFGYDQSFQQVLLSIDGSTSGYVSATNPAVAPSGIIADNLGGFVDATVGNGTTYNYQGDLSFAAEFSGLFQPADITALYLAWKNSFAGESSDARYARILGWAGYQGSSSIQAGMTTSMGAAAVGGQDALSALQAVVDTENGAQYVAVDGALTFKSRSARYNALTPTFVFGENAAGGEIPYENVDFDYDTTRTANQVKVTQASTNQVFSAQDAASITNFFPRQLTRTVNSSSTQECQDAANYLLSRYKTPAVRIRSIKLHPSANPSLLWPVCLSLELGTRVRVMRRPPSPAAPMQVDCFVENLAWEFADTGEAWLTLQCSPVDLTPYGLFAAFHTTLNGSPTAGVTSITINAGADNTNVAAAQLGQGQQLVLGLGTANQETVTILAVGATSPAWATATITLQAATTKAHTAGDIVCEPLPAGVSVASTYDASARFDSAAFAY